MAKRRDRAGEAREPTHQRTVARRLDERAASADGGERWLQAALRAAAARLQALAARMAGPVLVPAPVPIPVTAVRPRRRRAG